MIEGMVMELYKDHVVVMTKSGEFLKLRKRGIVNIGDLYKENIYRRIPIFTYAAAAILIFVFTSFAGYTAYANQIVGYVDIKGNKDVRLYVSRNGTVEKVDGVQNASQIRNLPVDQAIEELNIIAPVEGIYNDSSEVAVSTTEVKDSKLDFNKVNEKVKKILSKDSKSHDNNSDKNQPNNSSKENNSEKNKDDSINNDELDKKDKENDNNSNSMKDKDKDKNKDESKNTKQDNKNNKNQDKKIKNSNDKNGDNKNKKINLYEFNKHKYNKSPWNKFSTTKLFT